MIGQGFASSSSNVSPSTFAEALDRLKSRGCLVLVVGPVGDDAKYAGCRRLLGDELSETRRRLFLTTDRSVANHPGAKATCGHSEPTDSRAITYKTGARGTAAAPMESTLQIENEVVHGDLDDLLAVTESAIVGLETRAGEFEPGELRVCVDDLAALIAHDDDVAVVEFISALRERILDASGLGHAHLSRDVPAAPVDAIACLFDAILEVDSSDECRQRWHVRHAGISTDWLEL